MAPVSFGDISKTAKDILDNDFQTSGYQFKSKQKTSWNSAVVTTAVDLFGKDDVKTPGKLTWKIPNPVGIMGFSIDKFEMDKSGKFKFEAGIDKTMHKVSGLKLDVKSDLKAKEKVNVCATYTGLADKRLQVETTVMKPEAFTLEGTAAIGKATLGLKCDKASLQKPDVGVRFATGPLFAALLATKKLSVVSAFTSYNISSALKVAGTCEQAVGKSLIDISAAAAVQYTCNPKTTLKAKVTKDQVVSLSVKQDLSKGFTVLAGGKYEITGGKYSYGLQLSVE